MLTLTGYKFCLYTADADMRQGSNGLSGIVQNCMKYNPLDEKMIYVFFNKRRNQVKLLLWEEDGYAVYHKRLTKGTFAPPAFNESGGAELSRKQMSLILDGIELTYRKRYNRYA